MPIAHRTRDRSVEIFTDTTDTRTDKVWNILTGNVIRDRTRDHSTEQVYYSPVHTCTDTVGYYERENPLVVVHENVKPPVITYSVDHTRDIMVGGVPNGDRQQLFRDYNGFGPHSHCLALDELDESDIEFVTRAAANTNPSRSSTQALVFLAELRDLPSLFKDIGDEFADQGFIRGTGNQILKGQYGWRPLIKDLRTFFDMSHKIENRVKTLKELRSKGRIKRRFKEPADQIIKFKQASIRLGEDHDIGVHPSSDDTIYFDAYTDMYTIRWCDVEYALDFPDTLFPPVDTHLWNEAQSLIYGTNIDGPTLWAAMPWSWFIDWHTNMSDFIKSQNNVVGARFASATLMKTTRRETRIYPVTDVSFPTFNGQWTWQFLPGSVNTLTKERIIGLEPSAVTTTEPILTSEFRSSIYSGLFMQNFTVPHRLKMRGIR